MAVALTGRILSFGGGVNTVALLLELVARRDPFEEVVFADTQGEWRETYNYLTRYVRPFCADNEIPFTVVLGDEDKLGTVSLEEWCLRERKTPSRRHRWCTDRFKIRPIKDYVRKTYGKAVCLMGIDYDEITRIHEPHYSEISNIYPLVDWKWTRTMCERTILRHGWMVPRKSGCWYCPFQRVHDWRALLVGHPDLFGRAETLERNSESYPRFVLSGTNKPLARLKVRFGDGFAKIEDFLEEPCDSGYCFL